MISCFVLDIMFSTISLSCFQNDLILLNYILNNNLPIKFFDFWTIDNGANFRTGNKTFSRLLMITKSKLSENLFYRVAEMSNTHARSNNFAWL